MEQRKALLLMLRDLLLKRLYMLSIRVWKRKFQVITIDEINFAAKSCMSADDVLSEVDS